MGADEGWSGIDYLPFTSLLVEDRTHAGPGTQRGKRNLANAHIFVSSWTVERLGRSMLTAIGEDSLVCVSEARFILITREGAVSLAM